MTTRWTWPTASGHASAMARGFAGEPGDASVLRLVEQLGVFRTRMAHGDEFDGHLPYGAMDWTVLALHALWDSWVHEREVLDGPPRDLSVVAARRGTRESAPRARGRDSPAAAAWP